LHIQVTPSDHAQQIANSKTTDTGQVEFNLKNTMYASPIMNVT